MSISEHDLARRILHFGLPGDFDEDVVTHSVGQFTVDVLGYSLGDAIHEASIRDFRVLVRPLPSVGADVWTFFIDNAGGPFPLMVTLEHAEPSQKPH